MALVNVYIRKMGADGEGNARPTYNIREHFGFVIQELPFDLSTDVKDVDTVDYFDEDGIPQKPFGRIIIRKKQ